MFSEIFALVIDRLPAQWPTESEKRARMIPDAVESTVGELMEAEPHLDATTLCRVSTQLIQRLDQRGGLEEV